MRCRFGEYILYLLLTSFFEGFLTTFFVALTDRDRELSKLLLDAAPFTVLWTFCLEEAACFTRGDALDLTAAAFLAGAGLDLVFLGADTDLPLTELFDFETLRLETAAETVDILETTLRLDSVFLSVFFGFAEVLDLKDMLSLSLPFFFFFAFSCFAFLNKVSRASSFVRGERDEES